ncbi:MAG: CoB--CoM heterodisulfide reductase iron-sulfur subunit A family protein [Acidobacteria bacterium]|nr:CoB--CoM heterodisulfide reductase iron-sulfur subunit A family protein [Acidobacteriota bacterium]
MATPPPAPPRVGVLLCHDAAVSDVLDLDAIGRYAASLDDVAHVSVCGPSPPLDPARLASLVEHLDLTAVVVGGVRPGYLKPAVTRAMALAGRDPEAVRLAPFRARDGTAGDAVTMACAAIACAVHGIPLSLVTRPESRSVLPTTLVIGGGVSGIQTALELADAGKPVCLVERSPTIGGHMAMFDKTFPTLDCAACILTPKMVSVGQHEAIDLRTCCEVAALSGEPGAFHVTLLQRARRVDADACVSCDLCTAFCPVQVPSEFDAGIAPRKAIYLPFPQAIPNTYVVDPDACTWILTDGKKCGACLKKCAKNAIHLDEQDRLEHVDVGNIVVATGYDVFDARRLERYGYGVHPNVLNALEFERLTNASGPTGGRIVMKTRRRNKRTKQDEWVFEPDGPAPRRLAIIHCVGSRDEHFNRYCSRVCCMYSLKFAHLVREKLPEADCFEFYIDMRAFGKGYEEFFERIREEGVHVVRGRSARVTAVDGRLMVKGEDIVGDCLLEFPVDMVLLSVGLEPAAGARHLAEVLGIAHDADGFFREADYNIDPTGTDRGGIFVAGACQGPKDIPDAVAQASAVAARVLKTIASGVGRESAPAPTLATIDARARSLAARLAREEAVWPSA